MPIEHNETPTPRTNPSGERVWIARYTAPNGRRLSAGTFKLKRDAQKAINAAYTQPARRDTIGAYLPLWLEEHPVSDRTMRTNRGRIQAVLDVPLEGRRLGDWPICDLRRRHAKDLVAHLLTVQGRAPEGARNILRALSVMAEDAISDELADVNPWRGVKVRDDDKRAVKRSREPRVWSWEDMHRFASCAGAHEPMVRTLADCGLRIGELLALRRAGLDAEAATLRVEGTAWKGEVLGSSREKQHDRLAPVPPTCLALLRSMPVRLHSPWLFPTPTGRLWQYDNFKRDVWNPTVKRAGISPTPQDFRHSYVTHLRAAAIDPADLADVAGHSIETASARYTHALGRSYDAIRGEIG
jgi:integrase